ncbi:hypothetical protein SETIT_4G264800v2 [Setaria italica]|uniref:Uncharacterized protein n=1 Tax=Setaria italica TaxID=4555 RepID=A0A368QYW9_SETIT|nr:hypothetical protein SETIT_4G264800v2 [Setaria italica]
MRARGEGGRWGWPQRLAESSKHACWWARPGRGAKSRQQARALGEEDGSGHGSLSPSQPSWLLLGSECDSIQPEPLSIHYPCEASTPIACYLQVYKKEEEGTREC